MLVIATIVPWIERVEAYNVACYMWQFGFVVLQHAVHVFIVSPGHQQIVNTAIWLINAIFRVVFGILAIGISYKAIGAIDNAFAPFTAHRKGVTHYSPLWLIVEGHHLAEIVYERG